MQNSEKTERKFVDQRYPSVIISEAELKKDYGKQIADGDVDPSSLSFGEWLFNQMEETGGTLSHYTPPEPELPEFPVLLRETFVLRTKVKAKSYLEAMQQVEHDYNDGKYCIDNFACVEYRPCCSNCGEDFDDHGVWIPDGTRLVSIGTPMEAVLCENCYTNLLENTELVHCSRCHNTFHATLLKPDVNGHDGELCPYCGTNDLERSY